MIEIDKEKIITGLGVLLFLIAIGMYGFKATIEGLLYIIFTIVFCLIGLKLIIWLVMDIQVKIKYYSTIIKDLIEIQQIKTQLFKYKKDDIRKIYCEIHKEKL